MDSEQRAGEPTVLTAKPNPQWPTFVYQFQAWFAMALMVVLALGPTGLLVPPRLLTIVLCLAGTALDFLLPVLSRLSVLDVLSYDEEGVVLRPSRRGFLAPKLVRFRWDEVKAVRRGSVPSRHDLRVSLARVHRFWTLRPRRLTIGTYFWRDEGFRQGLRRHVSGEKIAAGVLDEAGATGRRALFAGGVLLACAAGTALCCAFFRAVPGLSVWTLVWLLYVCWLLGYLVWCLGFGGLWAAERVVTGTLFAAPMLFLSLDLLAVLNERWSSTLLAGLSAASGLFLGAAVMVFLGPRTRWSHVGVFYLLGAAGWGVGVLACDGVPSVLLGEVTAAMPTATWTVTGDGFVLEQRAGERVLLQWYSADGKPERSVAVPVPVPEGTFSSLLVVGPEAAIYEVASEGRDEGFVVPRYGGVARRIVMNPGWRDVRLSPDGRRCVFVVAGTRIPAPRGAPWAVSYLELPDGELQQASFPPGQDHAESIGILNDGRLVLVTGEKPEDLEGRGMWYGSELPEGDTWKPTYEPVKVWVWDPQAGEAPTLLHAEEQMSLDWGLPTTSSPLYICRVVGDGARRKESVEVRLDSDPPEVRPCRPGKIAWWRADQASADRRFVVKTYGKNTLSQMCVRDTVTRRGRRLRDQPGWCEPWVLWSPSGHKFLYTTADAPLIMPWDSRFAAATAAAEPPRLVEVARLVDLDR
jgi:hypothetical protein